MLEDEEEVQDVETTQNLAVETHSQQKESSASLTEQKGSSACNPSLCVRELHVIVS